MEEVVERENLIKALKRVKANKGSPGVDGMTVDELSGYLNGHWVTIREQLMGGTYEPQPVRRVEIEKPDGGVRKLRRSNGGGPVNPAGGATGFATEVGPDVFR